MFTDQSQYDIRCEWGNHALHEIAASDVIIIVDILSFSTCVELALSNNAIVLPYPMNDSHADEYAREHSADLASKRGNGPFSLSPVSMSKIPAGTRLVLPSPNGSHLTFYSKANCVLNGCIRNAQAVAKSALQFGKTITVIPAGERWNDDQSLRPAIEDLIGAGAIIHYLGGQLSPEARIAEAAFKETRKNLEQVFLTCASGRELVQRGFKQDVQLAAELNISSIVPIFKNPEYLKVE